MSQAILDALEKSGQAFDQFKTHHKQRLDKFGKQIDRIVGRAEDLEARGKTRGKTSAAADGLNVAAGAYYELRGPGDTKSFVVSREQKLANIPALKKQEPVSMERWAAAVILGNGCGDKEAVEFAAESKSLAT